MSELREQLAALCHDQWSGWMAYLFSKSKADNGGQTIIPPWATERWARQAGTMYDGLSDSEKDSDRKEADRFLALLEAALAEKDARITELEAQVPKWVSVEDELPTHADDVLVFGDTDDGATARYWPYDSVGAGWACENKSTKRWWNIDGDGYEYPVYRVTHWMPLPTAPKEGS